jgi:CubicO group peptidase (beta-lactamase class C family)
LNGSAIVGIERAAGRAVIVAGLMAATGCATGGPVPPAPGTEATTPEAQVDALMRPYAGEAPGAAVLVMRDGEVVLRRAYGLSDVAHGVSATPVTNFRLASISKQFTAAAILLLAGEGRLALDDGIRAWLPELPRAADGVTLHHLLSHQSGLVDYEDLIPADATVQVRDADVLALLAPVDRRYFPPGTAYRYSNSGYALLALVVERVAGAPFQDVLRDRIFLPLGMDDTVARVDGGARVPRRAYGHSREDGRWTRTDQSITSAVLGDGGIYASIDDLATWLRALDADRLLPSEARQLATSAHAVVTGEPGVDAYGYGWRLGPGTLWHSGETRGFRNVMVRWPDEGLTVIVLTNRDDPAPRGLALRIRDIYARP